MGETLCICIASVAGTPERLRLCSLSGHRMASGESFFSVDPYFIFCLLQVYIDSLPSPFKLLASKFVRLVEAAFLL